MPPEPRARPTPSSSDACGTWPGRRRQRVRRYLRGELTGHASRFRTPLDPFARLAAYHAAHLGEHVIERQAQDGPLLAAPRPPPPGELDGDRPTPEHLTCIRPSSAYWTEVWRRRLRAPRGAFDRDALIEALERQRAASKHARQLHLAHWRERCRVLLADMTLALLRDDEQRFNWAVDAIAARRDQRLEEDAAVVLGEAAPHVPLGRFEKWLAIWTAALGHARQGFVVAWHAGNAGAPDHALAAARLATARHGDRSGFALELERLKRRFPGR